MRKLFLVPAIVAATLALAPMANAAEMMTGVVKAFSIGNGTQNSLTLNDGKMFVLPASEIDSQPNPAIEKLANLKTGDKVTVSYDSVDGQNVAYQVNIL